MTAYVLTCAAHHTRYEATSLEEFSLAAVTPHSWCPGCKRGKPLFRPGDEVRALGRVGTVKAVIRDSERCVNTYNIELPDGSLLALVPEHGVSKHE